MSQKKEHKPCNKAQQSQSQKQSRSGKQISGESSLLGNAGNSNNVGQAWTSNGYVFGTPPPSKFVKRGELAPAAFTRPLLSWYTKKTRGAGTALERPDGQHHSGQVRYQGWPATAYRVEVTLFAENDQGRDSRTWSKELRP